jgi:hypothetical protein
MLPEDIAKVIPLCDKCGRAKNPAAPLQWFDTERGLMCAHCYTPPPEPDTTGVPMVVIACPSCRRLNTEDCPYCTGLGVVRVPMNAIPVWTKPAGVLTEDS